MSTEVILDGENLKISELAAISRSGVKATLDDKLIDKMQRSREMLEKWIEEERIVYGVTTGFGPLVSRLIPTKFQTDLQVNLIRSHSANVGPVFSKENTRAAMALRINAFAKGFSAIRVETVDRLKQMLNAGVHPRVPEWGSVGASGDLTPSAHIALALMGEGEVEFGGDVLPAKDALDKVGIKPVVLAAKEGLALINGTTMMTGVGAMVIHDTWNLVKTAEIISVLSMEALLGSAEPFIREGHEAKPHPGQLNSVDNIRKLMQGSKLIWNGEVLKRIQSELSKKMKESEKVLDSGVHVQNVYSMRATPQIMGAVRDALDYVTARITTEMNSANDNPLFFPDLGIPYQGANFHGQSVALPMDVLSIALTEIGIISERRLNKMLDEDRSAGLSPFLANARAGLRCGFEGAQYIPTSLVAECRTLCNPASIQSIPSNAENQDVVSMGLVAARKARDIRDRIEYILVVELLAACQALEERDMEKMSVVSKAVHKRVREKISPLKEDRVMTEDFEKMKNIIHNGDIVSIAEDALGEKLV
jgi:MIO-dependent L-tyrosine 2,3-aminomutase